MPFSSVASRPANRAAFHSLLVAFALLVAAISGVTPDLPLARHDAPIAAQQATRSVVVVIQAEAKRDAAPAASVARAMPGAAEPANSAGEFGFWMLLTLCIGLLSAGVGQRLVQLWGKAHAQD